MIEVCRLPRVRVVASQTIMRIITGDVIRIRCSLKIRLMAGEAVFGRAGETTIDVTLGAIDRYMRAG